LYTKIGFFAANRKGIRSIKAVRGRFAKQSNAAIDALTASKNGGYALI
jgi:hypothetical protein